MITRACISINNQCNLRCKYCHFQEKAEYIHEHEMDMLFRSYRGRSPSDTTLNGHFFYVRVAKSREKLQNYHEIKTKLQSK